MKVFGIIQSGVGKGAHFTRLEWVMNQCERILGYRPFPGTLNVCVVDEDVPVLDRFLQNADLELIPDDPAFCAARVKKVMVNHIPGALVLPSEDVRIHANRVVEIIASCSLKDALGLHDGDRVTLSSESRNGKKP
jgi:riboflavin kinase